MLVRQSYKQLDQNPFVCPGADEYYEWTSRMVENCNSRVESAGVCRVTNHYKLAL